MPELNMFVRISRKHGMMERSVYKVVYVLLRLLGAFHSAVRLTNPSYFQAAGQLKVPVSASDPSRASLPREQHRPEHSISGHKMCLVGETCHTSCGHLGRRRFFERCGQHPCERLVGAGHERVNGYCPNCTWRRRPDVNRWGCRWDISESSMRLIDEMARKRQAKLTPLTNRVLPGEGA